MEEALAALRKESAWVSAQGEQASERAAAEVERERESAARRVEAATEPLGREVARLKEELQATKEQLFGSRLKERAEASHKATEQTQRLTEQL